MTGKSHRNCQSWGEGEIFQIFCFAIVCARCIGYFALFMGHFIYTRVQCICSNIFANISCIILYLYLAQTAVTETEMENNYFTEEFTLNKYVSGIRRFGGKKRLKC